MTHVRIPRERLQHAFNDFLENLGAIGLHFMCALRMLFMGEVNMREFWRVASDAAWSSVGTVVLTSATIGLVSSLQSIEYFSSFGASGEIGGINAMALMRELAPIITAIVLTGRVGSAWAAEIGSMKITEQISALQVMNISVERFLIAPRVLASMLAMPILNVFAFVSGMVGGYWIAHGMEDMSLQVYIQSVDKYVDLYDYFVTNLKSVLFGATVASISCSLGLKATGGATGLGRYTTKAVVTTLVTLFLFNYLLSFIFYSL
jgi:phospholipid/cholesterol/gamma-HCH transport system permease protein